MNIRKQATFKITIKSGKEIKIESLHYTNATEEMSNDEKKEFLQNECLRIDENKYLKLIEISKVLEDAVYNKLLEINAEANVLKSSCVCLAF
jgi:hypothetical protein